MLEESATVVEVAPDGRVWVETVRRSGCGNCQTDSSCGSGQLLTSRQQPHPLQAAANGHVLAKGDRVLLGIAEDTVWQGLCLLYVMPLVLLAAGGLSGQWLAGETGAVAGVAAGVILGLLAARRWSAQQQPDKYLPIVIKRLSP